MELQNWSGLLARAGLLSITKAIYVGNYQEPSGCQGASIAIVSGLGLIQSCSQCEPLGSLCLLWPLLVVACKE